MKKIFGFISVWLFLLNCLVATDAPQNQKDSIRVGEQHGTLFYGNNVATGDVNGDGIPDIFRVHPDFPNQIWFATGDGNFSAGPALDLSSKSYATAMGDLDGNGTMDIVIGNQGPNTIWFNSDQENFIKSDQEFAYGFTAIIILDDIDHDQDPDILSFSRDSGLEIWRNDGNGRFSPGQTIGELSDTLRAFSADVNRDGNSDLVVKRYNRPDSVWLNNGNGIFSESRLHPAHMPEIQAGGTDFNGDRLPDIVMFDKNNVPRLNVQTGENQTTRNRIYISPLTTGPVSASVNIVNPSFETGDLSGWSLFDMADPFLPMQAIRVNSIFGWWFFYPIPAMDGNWVAINGFDGGGPDVIHLRQRVQLPENKNVLKFDYRAAWDMSTFIGSTQLRSFYLNIQPVDEPDLELRKVFLVAPPNSRNNDTGQRTGTLDLSQFSGKKVNISFKWWIPEPYTGPGEFHLDNVRIINTDLELDITSPNNNELVFGTVPVKTRITHDKKITDVAFYIDGVLVETRKDAPFTYDWDTSGFEMGKHTIKAVVKDIIGAHDTDSVEVELATPTSVKILSPPDQSTVSGPNRIQVSIAQKSNVEKVVYYLNGTLLGDSSAAPFDYSWASTMFSNGSHVLKAVAHFKTGETGEDSVNITIDNIVLALQVTRYKAQAWIVRKDYARLTVNLSGGNPALVDKLIIYRKDVGDFSTIHQFTTGDMQNGGYTFEDKYLDPGQSYTYKVIALDAYGGTIGESPDTAI